MRDTGVGPNDLLLLPSASNIQSLEVVLDCVILVRDVLARFRFLVVANEILKPVGQQLPDQHLRLRVPRLIGFSKRRKSFKNVLCLVAELLLNGAFSLLGKTLALHGDMKLRTLGKQRIKVFLVAI